MKLRRRAAAVVFKNGKILLVKDKKAKRFSLPGGGIRKNEPTLSAAIREVYEETHLAAVKAKRRPDLDFKGKVSKHKVCLITVRGKVVLNKKELKNHFWWDPKKPLTVPVYPHVRHILGKLLKSKL
ncbi:MAG: NUDIX hydrolase [Archaeoglobus sp.]|nr:NUDIX hydrolase [Archaeoglobus sp.]